MNIYYLFYSVFCIIFTICRNYPASGEVRLVANDDDRMFLSVMFLPQVV